MGCLGHAPPRWLGEGAAVFRFKVKCPQGSLKVAIYPLPSSATLKMPCARALPGADLLRPGSARWAGLGFTSKGSRENRSIWSESVSLAQPSRHSPPPPPGRLLSLSHACPVGTGDWKGQYTCICMHAVGTCVCRNALELCPICLTFGGFKLSSARWKLV